MKKKIAAIALGGVMTLGLMLPLGGCMDSVKAPEWDSNVTIDKKGATVTWDAVEGATEYKVYHALSRYANYNLESTQKDCKYTNADKYGYYRVDAMKGNTLLSSQLFSYDIDTFGNTMRVYAPTDDEKKIQEDIDAACDNTWEFSENRFAAFFKSGEYSNLDLRMRYYMTFAGLGELPTDVELGHFNVWAERSGGNATCNFWCGIENMEVKDNVRWAVSQATSFRRMQVNGNVALTQKYAADGSPESSAWGSDGFISDTVITGTVDAGGQQQWLTRNSKWGNWVEGDMNLTYVGCDPASSIPEKGINGIATVTVKEAPVLQEKPFLTFGKTSGYSVYVPALQENAKGVSWLGGEMDGTRVSLDKFYVARADRDTAETINTALQAGRSIFFTPGIYKIDKPILVEKKDTILLGSGLATLKLTAKNTDTIMRISDVDGVKLGGLMFDAGPSSKTLLEVGDKKTRTSHAADPITLNDIYFRIGGAENANTKVDQTLVINANDVIGDNFWVWRADHSSGVAWEPSSYENEWGETVEVYANETKNGVVVNGDNVTIYGLMVEHFHEYQTIWNGENGFMCFYQSETPYNAPNQESWMSEWNGQQYRGYASYKVADDVQTHTAYGLGIYYVTRGVPFALDHGIELPSNDGIHVEHMVSANFSMGTNGGGIEHIVNGYGKSVIAPCRYGQKTSFTSFIAGQATE